MRSKADGCGPYVGTSLLVSALRKRPPRTRAALLRCPPLCWQRARCSRPPRADLASLAGDTPPGLHCCRAALRRGPSSPRQQTRPSSPSAPAPSSTIFRPGNVPLPRSVLYNCHRIVPRGRSPGRSRNHPALPYRGTRRGTDGHESAGQPEMSEFRECATLRVHVCRSLFNACTDGR